ncbi:hypothetical protein NE865_12164 [Phthorimaea operculella]|nr:hypothetical protein NE865_12164 [Phthorimaea operculella]
MISLPDNVRQDLVKLLPASLVNQVTCFVFYDNHPRDQRNIDITVCTLQGEVKEFSKRDLVNSIIISGFWESHNIKILRNNKCDLIYLVSCKDEIAIVSSSNKLEILHRIKNIEWYELEDSVCRGQARLKIILKDDAVPLFFDENFKKLGDRSEMFRKPNADDSLPIITQLARKLTEVKYSVKCNEKVLKDLSNMRQLAAYSHYKKCSSRENDAVFHEKKADTSGPLKIINRPPGIIVSNKKLTIIIKVENKGTLMVENINVLLHSSQAAIVYTTKVFDKISASPRWAEKTSNAITPNSEYNAIVAVIDLNELKYRITSKINLKGAISYKVDSKEYLLAFEEINLSATDTMHELYFDVLSRVLDNDEEYNIIAYLATSMRTDLYLRVIDIKYEPDGEPPLHMFSKPLQMEEICNMCNVAVHIASPYHILYGTMLVEREFIPNNKFVMSLHTRSKDQILAFIHYMHDAIPFRILATTTNQEITSKVPELAKYDEYSSDSQQNIDYSGLKLSLLNQTSMTLAYLDECMMRMNESKNSIVLSKVGKEIDIYAGGESRFLEFKSKLLAEAAAGISSICEESHAQASEGMAMEID